MVKKRDNFTRIAFIHGTIVTGIGLTMNLVSCKKSEAPAPTEPEEPTKPDDSANTSLRITGVSIPFNMDVSKGMDLKITGQGFAEGDEIIFRLIGGGNQQEMKVKVKNVTANTVEVVVPEEVVSARYEVATDKSRPIILAMHINLFSNPSLNGSGNETRSLRLTNAQELINLLGTFSNVHVFTAHTHMNYNARYSPSLMEHNIGAVCGTWWWTGYLSGNHFCKDGTPGGYVIWEMDGKDLKWTSKSIGYEEDYQFRTYDLNKVHITKEKYAPAYTGTAWNTYAVEYAQANLNNEVLVNVWNYDTDWTVEVRENGITLPVTRGRARDPLHIISYSARRLDQNAVPTADFVTALSAHLFKVKASSSTSTLEIRVTDSFGRVYTETMVRPKEFGLKMV